MLAVLSTFPLLLIPQVPQLPGQQAPSPQMRFVDFSRDLERPGVTALVARLGRMKEGRRQRIRDGGHLGGSGTQVSVSGTQYYKVPVRARLEQPLVLAGADPGKRLDLEFEIQLARLPDGTERRQTTTANGTAIAEDLLALWVLEKPRRGKKHQLLHVIPFHPGADRGPRPEAAFEDNVRDFCAINQRILELRQALAETDKLDGDEARAAALERLRKLQDQPEMRNPAHDSLLTLHTGPLLRRLRDRIAALDG